VNGEYTLARKRLDVILLEKGFFRSIDEARRSIMAGTVTINGRVEDKPGTIFRDDIVIEIKQDSLPYASRGGLKLEKALKEFGIDVTGKVAMDVGASTGGFTDCLLKYGAAKVYAVDVGYGQLAWNLRNDPRVINMERTNVRFLKPEDIPEPLDFVSIDVSFISLRLVLPVIKDFLAGEGEIISLVKPQFEAEREEVGKHGVVREKKTHIEVIRRVIAFAKEIGLKVAGITYSPIRGPEGNIEFLLYLSKKENSENIPDEKIEQLVNEAHDLL